MQILKLCTCVMKLNIHDAKTKTNILKTTQQIELQTLVQCLADVAYFI